MLAAAFVLTTLFTQRRIPSSTIQILVFCIVGAGAALHLRIRWDTIAHLVVLWVLAPPVAFVLGYAFTKLFDAIPMLAGSQGAAAHVGRALVVVGGVASLAMGANDVSNATAVFLSVGLCGPLLAGLIGGLGLAIGVLTWGRPLLERVAFDMVKMDLAMATAAQLVQALVVLTAVVFGYFTSMNQALIGAMAGTGFARGRQTIDNKVMLGVVRGWVIGPAAGAVLGYGFAMATRGWWPVSTPWLSLPQAGANARFGRCPVFARPTSHARLKETVGAARVGDRSAAGSGRRYQRSREHLRVPLAKPAGVGAPNARYSPIRQVKRERKWSGLKRKLSAPSQQDGFARSRSTHRLSTGTATASSTGC